jgi:hypothetical protein
VNIDEVFMIIFEDDNSQFGSYFFMNELTEKEKQEVYEYEFNKEQTERIKNRVLLSECAKNIA